MTQRSKIKKLKMGMAVIMATTVLSSVIAFASPIKSNNPSPLGTPYGQMTGEVWADVDNGGWGASTNVSGTAPVIVVKGSCKDRNSGREISSNSDTQYNADNASITGTAYPSRSVTVYSTHEVRGQKSHTRYCSVSQTY